MTHHASTDSVRPVGSLSPSSAWARSCSSRATSRLLRGRRGPRHSGACDSPTSAAVADSQAIVIVIVIVDAFGGLSSYAGLARVETSFWCSEHAQPVSFGVTAAARAHLTCVAVLVCADGSCAP